MTQYQRFVVDVLAFLQFTVIAWSEGLCSSFPHVVAALDRNGLPGPTRQTPRPDLRIRDDDHPAHAELGNLRRHGQWKMAGRGRRVRSVESEARDRRIPRVHDVELAPGREGDADRRVDTVSHDLAVGDDVPLRVE